MSPWNSFVSGCVKCADPRITASTSSISIQPVPDAGNRVVTLFYLRLSLKDLYELEGHPETQTRQYSQLKSEMIRYLISPIHV